MVDSTTVVELQGGESPEILIIIHNILLHVSVCIPLSTGIFIK